jgi:hypothetical protein
MKRSLVLTLVPIFVLSTFAYAQKRRGSSKASTTVQVQQTTPSYRDGQIVRETICKGLPIPARYVTAGETTDSSCPKGAWVIKKKGTRLETASSAGATTYGSDSVQYDRFDDVTRVWSPEIEIYNQDVSPLKPTQLIVRAAFVYRGQSSAAPRAVALVFSLRSSVREMQGAGSVVILADGKRYEPETTFSSKTLESYFPTQPSDELTERLGVNGLKAFVSLHREYETRAWLSYGQVKQVLTSSTVEVRLPDGSVTSLEGGQRAALLEFLNRYIPQ